MKEVTQHAAGRRALQFSSLRRSVFRAPGKGGNAAEETNGSVQGSGARLLLRNGPLGCQAPRNMRVAEQGSPGKRSSPGAQQCSLVSAQVSTHTAPRPRPGSSAFASDALQRLGEGTSQHLCLQLAAQGDDC